MTGPRPITAGQEPDPLPSELLSPSGVAAWVIRPEDLDRLGVLTADPHTSTPEELSALSAGRPDPQTLAADPHRPVPGAHTWPDDAVLVTYRELRRLVALHLEVCGRTMPSTEPWAYAKMRAAAMRDGETPLLLSEVLDQ